ncbi:hypothetical protein LUCX_84 [Xanthomonas phage vB_XciM_LucasX]|nr:hypothetical protein LUCX_84 [Xanthomonas phage vB_XciM_LucasX]
MTNNNYTLGKKDLLVHAAAAAMRGSVRPELITPGVILGIRRITQMKAEARWYGLHGNGEDVAEDFRLASSHGPHTNERTHFYVVDRAWNRFSHWWHRVQLHDFMYLRPLRSSDALSRELKLFRTRELFI